MEKKIFKIKYVTNIGLGYWVDRFDGEFGTIGHYNVLLLPFCIIRWGTVTKIDPKPIWKQIIETCGGEEEFMKSAGLLPKEETLEEVAIRYEETDFNTTPTEETSQMMIQRAFINGAKWQFKKMFTNEEVESLLHKFIQSQIKDWHGYSTTKWFEQYKKTI